MLGQKRSGDGVSPLLLASECEDVQHRAGLYLLQLGRRIDKPLVPCPAQADQDGQVLLAINREGDRRCVDAASGVELPELLQTLSIERHHFSRRLAGKDQVRRGENATEIGEGRLRLAGDLAGRHIDGRYAAGDLERLARSAARPEFTGL